MVLVDFFLICLIRNQFPQFQANTLTDIDRRKYTKLLRYLFGYGAPLSIITLTLGQLKTLKI